MNKNLKVYFPHLQHCTDNAVMVAGLAYYKAKNSDFVDNKLELNPYARNINSEYLE